MVIILTYLVHQVQSLMRAPLKLEAGLGGRKSRESKGEGPNLVVSCARFLSLCIVFMTTRSLLKAKGHTLCIRGDCMHLTPYLRLTTFTVTSWNLIGAWMLLALLFDGKREWRKFLDVTFHSLYGTAFFVFVVVWFVLIPLSMAFGEETSREMLFSPRALVLHNVNVLIMLVESRLSFHVDYGRDFVGAVTSLLLAVYSVLAVGLFLKYGMTYYAFNDPRMYFSPLAYALALRYFGGWIYKFRAATREK